MISYIIKTLKKEDNVLIDGLGLFYTQFEHAKIDGDIIRPPLVKVLFEQNTDMVNNFSLANTISAEKQCLFTEANEEIIKWVDELKKALENNKSVAFDNFGSFTLDKRGNICFVCDKIKELNTQFEYLEAIKIDEIAADKAPVAAVLTSVEEEPVAENIEVERVADYTVDVEAAVEEEKPVAENIEAERIADDAVEVAAADEEEEADAENIEAERVADDVVEVAAADEEEVVENKDEKVNDDEEVDDDEDEDEEDEDDEDEDEDEEDDDDEDEDNHSRKRRVSAWLWVVCLLLIVLAALGFIFRGMIKDKFFELRDKFKKTEQVVPVEETDGGNSELNDNETITPDESQVGDMLDVEDEPVEPYTPEVVKRTADGKYEYIRFESGHYYAIAGSFYNEQDVEKHIRHKNLGQYSPRIVLQDGRDNLRVCIGVFDTEEEAETFAKGVNSSYWVLK